MIFKIDILYVLYILLKMYASTKWIFIGIVGMVVFI